jgi:hypothetical protein
MSLIGNIFTPHRKREDPKAIYENDAVANECAEARTKHVDAAQRVEKLLSDMLSEGEQLRQRTYHINAPAK